ncbi:Fusaric acid resistance protein family protein [Azospirillum oryzae]|uniref:Fusaric acid resistance protein family protein n=1 Tax=Azospirillum oryzae TaxID=286727 RepID=A0A1X7FK28_9PROT|nr:FUSC family protein [Azospirillum oryzae]SMF53527.1 Fusaric acid resistance protein family protein [Azospirillum oryzae]
MQSPSRFLAAAVHGDPVRRAVQTTVAAVGSYALMTVLGLPQASWAVISALFVTQINVGATFNSVIYRLASAVLGTATGLGCVYLIGQGPWQTALSLAVAAFIIDALSGRWPGLRFAAVVAGILIMSHQGNDPLTTALLRALAITIGALVAGLAALLILPVPAHRRAQHHLAEALRQCGSLMARLGQQDRKDDDEEQRRRDIHTAIRDNLQSVIANSRQSRHPHARNGDGPGYETLTEAVQRLWHTLDMACSIDLHPLSERARATLSGTLAPIAAEGCAHLHRIADAVEQDGIPPRPEGLQEDLGTARQRLGNLGSALPDDEKAQLIAVGLILREVGTNMYAIAEPLRGNDNAGGG